MVVNLLKLILLRNSWEGVQNLLRELRAFLGELFLHFEKVPVWTDAVQQAVEEVVEVASKTVADEDDVVTKSDLVFS